MDIESIRNFQESAVFERITAEAPHHAALAGNDDLLADVACVALNSLPPRYVRHVVDMHFYTTNRERAEHEAAVHAAVDAAFVYIARRLTAGAADPPPAPRDAALGR